MASAEPTDDLVVEADLIEVTNDHLVGKQAGGIVIGLPPTVAMDAEEALRLAAWIVACVADPLDERFEAVLAAVRDT